MDKSIESPSFHRPSTSGADLWGLFFNRRIGYHQGLSHYHHFICNHLLSPPLGRFFLNWRNLLSSCQSLADLNETAIGVRNSLPFLTSSQTGHFFLQGGNPGIFGTKEGLQRLISL